MPTYCFKCPECGAKDTEFQTLSDIKANGRNIPWCGDCCCAMKRDMESEGVNWGFSDTKGNMCRASTGYATNIDDAEHEMRKRGLVTPGGSHWYGKDKDYVKKTKRALRKGRHKRKAYNISIKED